MTHPPTAIQNVLFYFLLLTVGLYAGMHFFHEMCPVESQMTPLEYARYWKIVDGTYMHQRMGVMAPLMVGLFALNIVVNVRKWRSVYFLVIVSALIFFLADVALTVNQQLPINLFINELNLETISGPEMQQLEEYQKAALNNFQSRLWFALLSFAILGLRPLVRNTTNTVETPTRQSIFYQEV